MSDATHDFDVLVVGAGLSGIGAGYRLKTECPGKTFAILEARDAIGGTWDLFRYPGVRSDSDMFTLGYPFHPWRKAEVIADGASIRDYVRETSATFGIDPHIRFRRKIVGASWSSAEARWTLHAEVGPERASETYRCKFLYLCSGYYRYDAAHAPSFAGTERFKGRIVHPQWWPEDLDYAGKRVVVIGSGATAVTLVPALAHQAAHVTMLQRSPSYIASLPATDPIADRLRQVLPAKAAHGVVRTKNVLMGLALYQLCRRFPRAASKLLKAEVAKRLPRGLRHGPALLALVRPVGPAPLPGSERRLLQADARGQGRRGHRHHRDVHRDGPQAHLRQGARRRRHRHCHGPRAPAARRHPHRGRRQVPRAPGHPRLQGASC